MNYAQTWMYRELSEGAEVAARCLADNDGALEALKTRYSAAPPAVAVLTARGTSLHAAVFAKYLFERFIGLPTAIAEPSVVTKYSGALDLSNALVIGISQSGEGADVCAVVERGNDCGGLTVAVTNTDTSRLARAGGICLRCCAGEELSVSATKSFAAQLTLLLAVAERISSVPTLTDALSRCPDAIAAGFAAFAQTEYASAQFTDLHDCVAVARGLSYSIALEWALKLQEVCSVRAHAFQASNFLHGPIAMVNRDVPALLLATDAQTDDDLPDVISRLQARGARLLLVTNKPSLAELAGVCPILLPAWCEGILGAFAAVPVIQSFACLLSVAQNQNPDAPAGLNKVTITK